MSKLSNKEKAILLTRATVNLALVSLFIERIDLMEASGGFTFSNQVKQTGKRFVAELEKSQLELYKNMCEGAEEQFYDVQNIIDDKLKTALEEYTQEHIKWLEEHFYKK